MNPNSYVSIKTRTCKYTNLCHWRCCLIKSYSSQKPDCGSYQILTCCRDKNAQQNTVHMLHSLKKTTTTTQVCTICTMTYQKSEHMLLLQNLSTCWWWRAGVLVAVWACRWYWVSCGWGCPALSCPCCWSCHSSQCLDRPESDSACSSSSSAMSPC